MAATLDKKRHYGTVHGGDTGVHFVQDGKNFDAQGDEVLPKHAKPAAAAAPASSDGPVTVTKDAQGNLFRNGETLDLEDMTAETLHVLAKEMGLKLHPSTKRPKALAAIMEAAGPADELSAQLGE